MKTQKHIYILAPSIALLAATIGYLAFVLQSSIPLIVDEIRTTRQDIPRYLARIEVLVADMEDAGEKAAEGAVVGAVKGTIKAPFSLIASLGDFIKGSAKLSQSEQEVIAAAMENALRSGHVGSVYPFEHPSTELRGEIELLSVDLSKKSPTYSVKIEVERKGKNLFGRKLVLAVAGDGQLKLIKSAKL